jgi:hypothetical protein
MAQSIETIIELWREKALAEPLLSDREETVMAWVLGLNRFVLSNGFNEDDHNAALDDNPRTWAENEYDVRVKPP